MGLSPAVQALAAVDIPAAQHSGVLRQHTAPSSNGAERKRKRPSEEEADAGNHSAGKLNLLGIVPKLLLLRFVTVPPYI